jgi:hypothetical protein|tara:strand:- start:920 stop:1462 length:543 start_codon:yes stop_codon:yes gene_type:complete
MNNDATKQTRQYTQCPMAFDEIHNYKNMAHVGYEKASGQYTNPGVENLFNDSTGQYISAQITSRLGTELMGGRPIVVPMRTIWGILSALYQNYTGHPGGIHGRYTIPNNNLNVFQSLVNETITVIVENVRTSLEIDQINGSLSKWDTILGDFNDKGLRSHPPLNGNIDERMNRGQIHMRY